MAWFWCSRPLNRDVHWIQVPFKVNMGRKFRDFSWCPLNKGVCLIWGPLNTGFSVNLDLPLVWPLLRPKALLCKRPLTLGIFGSQLQKVPLCCLPYGISVIFSQLLLFRGNPLPLEKQIPAKPTPLVRIGRPLICKCISIYHLNCRAHYIGARCCYTC